MFEEHKPKPPSLPQESQISQDEDPLWNKQTKLDRRAREELAETAEEEEE